MKLPRSKKTLAILIAALAFFLLAIFFFSMPIAEVAIVKRGTAISAVYGTVRIEPTFVIHVRAQNSGIIQLADAFSAGRGAIGKSVEKGQLLATIADESTARQLKQAQADLQAANERAKLTLPSAEPLKVAEDNLQRLEKLTSLSTVPAVEFEKARSDVKRLRSAAENERIEQERNLEMLGTAFKKLEAQMKNSEIRSPLDGLLTSIQTIDGDLVAENNQLFTISSRKNYVRGEVNEEDVGEVKPGMKARLEVYAYRSREFTATVSAIQPAADPDTQRYTVSLDLENPPENLMAGMTGEMNIITGSHENAILVPTRALLVDQALILKHHFVQARTVKIGYRTLDFAEALSGIAEGDHVIVADQDKFRAGQFARQRLVSTTRAPRKP